MMFGSEWPIDFSTHLPRCHCSKWYLSLQWIFPFVSQKKQKHKVDLSTIIGVFLIRDDEATSWS
jgi:hypothetical protein